MNSKLVFISGLLIVSLAFSPLMMKCAEGAAAPTKVLKLGVTFPMQVREGLEQQKWLKLFTKLVNEEGGWKIGGERYKIEYLFYNDEYNAEKARAAAERLIFKDGVKHIINQWGGAPVLATIKVSDPNKVLVIGTAISDEPCKPQYQYAYKAVEPVPFVTAVSMSVVADYAKKGLKTVVYTASDDVTGHSMSDKDNISIRS